MYANEKVIENMDVMKLLEHYNFDTSNLSGTNVRAACEIHGGSNPTSFIINIETGLWFCHSGCGGGDIFTLVELMEKISFKESVVFLSNFFDVNIKDMKMTKNKSKLEKELKNFMSVIKRSHTKPLESFEYVADTSGIRSYRNFSKETLDRFKVVYADKIELEKKNGDKYHLYNRILIPIIKKGNQIGISLRKTKESDYPKWSHQPNGLKINNTLYNYDNMIGKKEIVIVEGVFDVWAYDEIGVTAVATFGAKISHQQYKLLIQSGADLIMSYDGDEAGTDGTLSAISLFHNKANLYRVAFDEGEDPASISREELLKRYERRRYC